MIFSCNNKLLFVIFIVFTFFLYIELTLSSSHPFSASSAEEDEFIKANVRDLSVPGFDDNGDHKCFIEIPTLLLLESPYETIYGNGTNMYWSRIEVCCKGYKRYEHDWNICVPDCNGKCKNGLCVAPYTCECFQGHVKNDDGECVTTCPLGCLNGRCHYDGTCYCNPGYELDSYTRKYCRPRCKYGCRPHQNCTAPEQCRCVEGYYMNEHEDCIPHCEPCLRGYCIGPNKCHCNPGYILKDGVCQADCYQRCENGRCLEKDTCTCNNGYYYDFHTTTCIPHCTDCVHGVCVAPEKCRCYRGYREQNGRCKPHCSKGCIHGDCVAPDNCICRHQGGPDELGVCRGESEQRCLNAINNHCIGWSKPRHHY